LWVADYGSEAVLEFAAGANGNVAPIRTIHGTNTTLGDPIGITIGPTGTIYVGDFASPKIAIFDSTANGNIAPTRTIAGSNTGFLDPRGVELQSDGSIVVSDESAESISTFASTANGNVAPIRVIAGSNTDLDLPYYLALDHAGNIYAANYSGQSISEYPGDADGNVAPTTRIIGASTGLQGPYPIAIDPADRIYIGDFDGNDVTVYGANLGISSVTSPVGTYQGGTTVTVHGYGFASGATVSFGGDPATHVTVVSSTTITAVTPAHPVGTVDVTVTQGADTVTLADGFRFVVVLAATGTDSAPIAATALGLLVLGMLLVGGAQIARRRRRFGSIAS
jgi:hypothetical protein